MTNSRLLLVLSLSAACLASTAEAKRVFIDFGDAFATSGSNWDSSQSFEVDRVGNLSGTAVSLGFTINTGVGSFNSAFINENGALTLGSALTSGSFTAVTNLATLGVPVIAPYYADLQSTIPVGGVFDVNDGEILYSRGSADPRRDLSGNYSEADAVQAFHATWAGPTVNGDATAFKVFTDVVLYNFGSGNFAIQLGHGNSNDPNIPARGGIAGFAMGANVRNLTGPRSGNEDLYYEFQNGAVVPAPATAPLLLTALAGLLTRCSRKRRQGQGASADR